VITSIIQVIMRSPNIDVGLVCKIVQNFEVFAFGTPVVPKPENS